jgi:phospholipid-translocating ATPase
MSNIPLHYIRPNQSRKGYTPVSNDTDNFNGNTNVNMRVAIRAAVSSSSSARKQKNIGFGKGRQDRYTDDPEEEATLLGEGQDEYEEEDRRRIGSPSRVS